MQQILKTRANESSAKTNAECLFCIAYLSVPCKAVVSLFLGGARLVFLLGIYKFLFSFVISLKVTVINEVVS